MIKFCFITALFFCQVAGAEILQYHPNSPAYIGGNYDPTYPGRAFPECLIRTTVRGESLLTDQKPGTASATQFFIKTVKSRRELYRMLNVSLSMSGSYGLFSGDMSASLEQENTFAEESFTWVVQGYSSFGKFILDRVELKPEVNKLKDNPVGFRNRCGTDYVQIELRAVQAAAVFTIKNLSESERRVLEVAFSASYGAGGSGLSIGADGKYSEFVKKAASYGQIEVNVYAIGGKGVSALSPIISNVEKSDLVLGTLQDYFKDLTLDRSVAVSYNTGSLQSLVNRPNIETDVFSKFIADAFVYYEDVGAEQSRVNKILRASEDWNFKTEEIKGIVEYSDKLATLRAASLNSALNCKAVFNDVNAGAQARRNACTASPKTNAQYARKFTNLSPKPYYLRYFVSNELIPNEEVLNFSIRGFKIKSVQLGKKVAASGEGFEAINSVQIKESPDASREAGTSILMKEILDADLPVGVRIEMDSGRVYFETFVFSRASAAVASTGATRTLSTTMRGPANISESILSTSRQEFLDAYKRADTLPNIWKEKQ